MDDLYHSGPILFQQYHYESTISRHRKSREAEASIPCFSTSVGQNIDETAYARGHIKVAPRVTYNRAVSMWWKRPHRIGA